MLAARSPRQLSLFSLFLAFGIILQAIEAIYLPSIPIPGVKIGLANLITLLMFIFFSPMEILLNVVLRNFVSALILGSFLSPAFYFSLAGSLTSFLLMLIAFKVFYPKISLVGISLIGAAVHNLGQLAVAFILVGHWGVFMQLPVLFLAAIPTGLFIGLIANLSAEKLLQIAFLKNVIKA